MFSPPQDGQIEVIDVFGACNVYLKAKALGEFHIKESRRWIFPHVWSVPFAQALSPTKLVTPWDQGTRVLWGLWIPLQLSFPWTAYMAPWEFSVQCSDILEFFFCIWLTILFMGRAESREGLSKLIRTVDIYSCLIQEFLLRVWSIHWEPNFWIVKLVVCEKISVYLLFIPGKCWCFGCPSRCFRQKTVLKVAEFHAEGSGTNL